MQIKPYASNQTLLLDSGCTVLYSYETPVVLIDNNNHAFKTDKKWSVTTSKHINQFLRKQGFDPKNDQNLSLVPQEVLNDWKNHEFAEAKG